MLTYRQAQLKDWEALMRVRLAVEENVLQNTALVTYGHYHAILAAGGCGWVCEAAGEIVGFSIVDLAKRNVWALFILPAHEKKGIGKQLHRLMLDWSFGQGIDKLRLSTDPGTRAAHFYETAGWQNKGMQPDGEMHFEITKEQWLAQTARIA